MQMMMTYFEYQFVVMATLSFFGLLHSFFFLFSFSLFFLKEMIQNTSTPTVWLDMSNAIQQVQQENSIPRQVSSQLTTGSSDTDFTHTTTTNSSIKTAPVRNSTSTNSLENRRGSDLRQQYEQRPEKVPDVAAEMEKWYAMTDR